MMQIIGTCDHCGGRVVSPMHHVDPRGRCEDCGWEVQQGPVLPMAPPRKAKDQPWRKRFEEAR